MTSDSGGQPRPAVLIVDDADGIRRRIRRVLEELGTCEIHEASTAAAGLGLAASLNARVVVLDIRLPDGNGIDVLARLRRAHPHTGVLIVTNFPDAAYRAACARFGTQLLDKAAEFDRIAPAVQALIDETPP